MRKFNKGFTLVELIIILALLASATAVAAPNIFSAESKAETEACRDQMDMILNGFQAQQFSSTSSYAYRTITDGQVKLTTYIANATDSLYYASVGMGDPAACPSGPTDYQAVVNPDDGRLYVYCPTHDAYSHSGLSGHEREPDEVPYTNLESWTGSDGNWIVGDHENFFVLPIEDQYYHMEIGFQLFRYDDGDEKAGDDEDDPIYDYHESDEEWYLEIPTAYYPEIVSAITAVNDKGRPYGYDLDKYNPKKKDLAFALAIDFQETEGGYNFSSNALELKNIHSNAAEEMTLDIMKESIFAPEATVDKLHNRQFFDGITDWLIVDVVPIPGNDTEKRMYVHMLDDSDVFQRLFVTDVPIADPEAGDIRFAFFMGKRVEDAVETEDKKVKNGLYYADGYPSPVQIQVKDWIMDYDGTDEASGRNYKDWYDTEKYAGYAATHPYILEK